MLDHIVDHSMQVCRVAVYLAEALASRGFQINQRLVLASALLHDITKTKSFATGENHAETGGQLISSLGYPEVGQIIRQHVRLDTYFTSHIPEETEIVNYADKRVLHDRIVPLKERMDYILEKYGNTPEYRTKIHWLCRKSDEIEKRLFRPLECHPASLKQLVEAKNG